MRQPIEVFSEVNSIGELRISTRAHFDTVEKVVIVDRFVTGHPDPPRLNMPTPTPTTARALARAIHEEWVKEADNLK
jgi:hypothetical protein